MKFKAIAIATALLALTACTATDTPVLTTDETPQITTTQPTISEATMLKHNLTEEEIIALEEMGIADESIEAWIDEQKSMGPGPFDFSGELADVSGGIATGTVGAYYEEGGYMLFAEFKDLPHPEEGFFYEGWIVRNSPLSVLSTGKAVRSLGDYHNNFTSSENLLDHDFYVLTLEPDDGNPEPADHILEGTMIKE